MTEWHDVAPESAVTGSKPLAVLVGGERIALFRVDEVIYATEEMCPHDWASLAEGHTEDGVVECPLHQAPFDVRTGKCLGPPADRALKTFPVRVEAGRLLIGVSS